MKKIFILPILCICVFLSACTAAQNPATPAMPPAAQLHVPPLKGSPYIYVEVINKTEARQSLAGTIMALMQSEHGAREAYSSYEADYVITVTLEKFGMLGSEEKSASATDLAVPGIAGVALGAQLGGAFGGEGALVGAGIGLMAGLALGSAVGSEELLVWHMEAEVSVKDKNQKKYVSRLNPKERGKNMAPDAAAATLENSIAWSVVRSFTKE